jgi:hypothetical protein
VQAFFDVMKSRGFRHAYRAGKHGFIVDFTNSESEPDVYICLANQCSWPFLDKRRVDFMVAVHHDDQTFECGVETDGAEFHASAERQLADKLKDRDFVRCGMFCLRFLGSELYRDAVSCVREVLFALENRIRSAADENQWTYSYGFESGLRHALTLSKKDLRENVAKLDERNAEFQRGLPESQKAS